VSRAADRGSGRAPGDGAAAGGSGDRAVVRQQQRSALGAGVRTLRARRVVGSGGEQGERAQAGVGDLTASRRPAGRPLRPPRLEATLGCKRQPITFWQFTKHGLVVTIVTIALLYVSLRYLSLG